MSYCAEFAPATEAEIIGTFNWYEQQSFGLGGEFLRAVKQSDAALSRNPHLHQILHKEIRRADLRRFPYALH